MARRGHRRSRARLHAGRRHRLRAVRAAHRASTRRSSTTAREAGAEVRERARVTRARVGRRPRGRRALRATATATSDELRAPLVVGADGRRSTVARLVGAERAVPLATRTAAPATSPTGATPGADWRGDRRAVARGRASSAPRSRATTACVLVLLMPPVERADDVPRRPRRRVRAHGRGACPGSPRGSTAASAATKVRHGDRHDVLLPPLVRPRLGAARRRRPLQGPGHRAGHPRRAALRAAARRGRRAGARRPARARPRAARAGSAGASASASRSTSGPTSSAAPRR